MARSILGIDLGTTNSCMALVDDSGKPQVISNSDNARTTPSVVWFDGARVVVGDEAKGMAAIYPTEVAAFVKREIGNPDFRFRCELGELRAEQVSAYVLRKLAQDAAAKLGEPVEDVVITCPAYFTSDEIKATRTAGEMAGLRVLEILPEPTAAAIAYGYSAKSAEGQRNILVYDLGGGTFDVSLITVSADGIRVVCTDGNHRLGGVDWDNRLVQLLADRFEEACGLHPDPEGDLETFQDLMLMAERVKIDLSSKLETTTVFSYGGLKQKLTITREQFESATADLLNETLTYTHAALRAAQEKGVAQVDELLLVGGSTRMPQVAQALQEALALEPRMYEPDEAVAKGAAIIGFGHHLRDDLRHLGGEKLGDIVLEASGSPLITLSARQQDIVLEVAHNNGITLETLGKAMTPVSSVCSKTFGKSLRRKGDGERRFFPIIYRNSSLPAEGRIPSCTIQADQSHVRVVIMESEVAKPTTANERYELERDGLPPEECNMLWEGLLPIQPGLPKGAPLETVFRLSREGILHVESRDPASGNVIEADIETACSIPEAEVAHTRDVIAAQLIV